MAKSVDKESVRLVQEGGRVQPTDEKFLSRQKGEHLHSDRKGGHELFCQKDRLLQAGLRMLKARGPHLGCHISPERCYTDLCEDDPKNGQPGGMVCSDVAMTF